MKTECPCCGSDNVTSTDIEDTCHGCGEVGDFTHREFKEHKQ